MALQTNFVILMYPNVILINPCVILMYPNVILMYPNVIFWRKRHSIATFNFGMSLRSLTAHFGQLITSKKFGTLTSSVNKNNEPLTLPTDQSDFARGSDIVHMHLSLTILSYPK